MTLANTRSPQSRMARLNDVRRRLQDIRTQRAEARKSFAQANDDGDSDAIKLTGTRMLELDEDYAKAKELETKALSALAGVSDSLGSTLRNSIEAQQTLAQIASSEAPLNNYVQVGEYMTAEELAELFGRRAAQMWGSVTTPDATDLVGERVGPSIQPSPYPALSLVDLFPAVPTSQRVVSYMVRDGSPSGADVVAHGAVKPSADFTYEAKDDEVPTIAVWTKCPRQDLADFDGLSADINVALSYDVRRRIEQLLIAAIRAAPGIGAPDLGSPWTDVDTIRDKAIVAAAEQAAFGFPANFAAYSPLDLAQLAITKTSGTGEYLQSPAGPREVPSLSIDRGDVLVGDSAIGAKLAIRSGLAISIGTESDDMVRNLVTILVECRILPVVLVPGAFSLVNTP